MMKWLVLVLFALWLLGLGRWVDEALTAAEPTKRWEET